MVDILRQIHSHVRKVDGQLDALQFQKHSSVLASPVLRSASDENYEDSDANGSREYGFRLTRSLQVHAAIRRLSITSSSKALRRPDVVWEILDKTLKASFTNSEDSGSDSSQLQELEWLLVSKATTQTYGITLNALLEQTMPLSDEIIYWDQVLGSYRYMGLYAFQTAPLRLWYWAKDVYSDAWQRLQSLRRTGKDAEEMRVLSVSHRWRKFYSLVKDSIRDRSLADMQSKFLSPMTMSRLEARSKKHHLNRLREMSATGLGVLMDEGMNFYANEEAPVGTRDYSNNREEWRSVVVKSVSLIETVLHNIHTLELGAGDFEETVFASVDDDFQGSGHDNFREQSDPQVVRLASRLQNILRVQVPIHINTSADLVAEYGKPSHVVRYWLPGLALLLSSSTLLRILFNRNAEITTWIRDFGITSKDFWKNWVVEPLKKVIVTIRHDKDSEIAIASKESLKGDRDSLERMVIDFARDNPSTPTGHPLSDPEISFIRAKVREGDLTPVLRAYEVSLFIMGLI